MCRNYQMRKNAAAEILKIPPCRDTMRIILPLLLFFSFGIALFSQEMSAKPLFAPGDLTIIPPDIDYYGQVVNRADIPELLKTLPEADPDLQDDIRFQPEIWARDIRLNRDIWCLQFSFKPLRLIDVDIPNAEGNYDTKKVWYLVYNVKNLGPADLDQKKINSSLGSAVPAGKELKMRVPTDTTPLDVPRSAALEIRQQTGVFAPRPGKDEPIRFTPHFVLATHRLVLETVPVTDSETGKTEWQTESMPIAYDDRIIPLALPKIAKREGMKALPETTVSIPLKEIASGEDLWGVAMWTDIDPRINEFSIFVSGLTNAYQWSNKTTADGTYENTGKFGEGRILKRRVLKLDWWRVGDKNSLNETQIHFGSKDLKVKTSVFEQNTGLSSAERKKLEEIVKTADTNKDRRVSLEERAIYHLIQQDWLKPRIEYEWVFL